MDGLRVGAFELYPSERVLCAAGKRLELGARAFDLLLVLAEQPGHLVTKATLLDRVWPGLVVEENNLPAQIASLRRVLGAGAIRTVPGFGYRLELAVQPIQAAEPRRTAAIAAAGITAAPSAAERAWPDRLGKLIGRDQELGEVRAALESTPLVTVVGIAGVGKTRLAREVWAHASDLRSSVPRSSDQRFSSVAWVALESITDLSLIPARIAVALELSLPEGVPGFTALRQALQRAAVLIILDSAEHLAQALALPLAELISQTQAVRILVTSQVPLGIAGETVYRLAVLSTPDASVPLEQAAHYGAVALFAQRVAALDRRFELSAANLALVTQICRRLDGIPLAIELAAARLPALGLSALLEGLNNRFRLLKSSAAQLEARHGALHTAFDWSYGLLSESEQRVFNWLGAFAGSFTLTAAARTVAHDEVDTAEAIDLVGRLVDRSLITTVTPDPPRYLLPETARYYARERLVHENELHSASGRMAQTMLQVLDTAYDEYWSTDEAVWLQRYAPEIDNVRAAMDWALEHDRSLGIALYGSSWPLFVETDLHGVGRALYERAVAGLHDAIPRRRVGRFWEAIATYESTRQSDRARYAAELAAGNHADTDEQRAHYYALMQLTRNQLQDSDVARRAFDQARQLEDPAWPPRLLAHGALTEGALLSSNGLFSEARAAYQRAVRFALSTSERQALAATVSIVELDLACGNTEAALHLSRPLAVSLRHLGRRDTRFELLTLMFGALLLSRQLEEARATGAELYQLASQLDISRLYSALDSMALLACEERRYVAAARIACCADAAHGAHGNVRRSPANEPIRSSVQSILCRELGSEWQVGAPGREPLTEVSACRLALGLADS